MSVAVIANGRPREASDGSSVADFLHSLELAAAQVIVEYNGEPLDRERFAITPLQPGDRIEIAQMVGGG